MDSYSVDFGVVLIQEALKPKPWINYLICNFFCIFLIYFVFFSCIAIDLRLRITVKNYQIQLQHSKSAWKNELIITQLYS